MFEKLVVSSIQRRKHTTAKFFAGTVMLYGFAFASALVLSVLVSDPRMADTNVVTIVAAPPPTRGDQRPPGPRTHTPPPTQPRNDPNHVMNLDDLMSRRDPRPPVISLPNFGNEVPSGGSSVGPFIPGGGGVPDGGDAAGPAPKPPDPPKPKPATPNVAADKTPLRVTSVVLQGKAIERRTPTYPALAKTAGVQDAVAVEVVISPEGRVESARAISGHPMLRSTAEEAARAWRFQPTSLNGVAVRVTGVITFVFKLHE